MSAAARLRRRRASDSAELARTDAGGPPPVRSKGRMSLSNWRVRWRLIAIIAVPTITALILGVIQIDNSVSNYTSFKRVQTLANLNALVVTAAGELADERDEIVGYAASGQRAAAEASGRPQHTALSNQVNADIAATNATLQQIKSEAGSVNSGFRAQTVVDLQNGVLAGISDLTEIREAALKTQYSPLNIVQAYDRLITAFDTFSNDVGAGTGNSTLQTDVTVLNALLRMEDDASLQRAYLYQALEASPQSLSPVALNDLKQASAQQQADTSQFDSDASVQESQNLNNTVSGPQVDEAQSEEELATTTAATNSSGVRIGTPQGCTNETAAQCWFNDQTAQIKDMRTVGGQLVSQIQSQANSLVSGALKSAVIISIVTVVLLLLVLLITTMVARSMIRPLRKLRADALEVAGAKLPEMVRRLSQSEGTDESLEIEPIGVNSTDEIGEVARAFDQVHREAVRLAADEAILRGNLNAMFVNLSRRSQSLIERQLSLIDSLEQSEQDPDRLSSLFRLDHMATRMRRNSENLLVLAGHEANRRWSQPVPLVDVLRAAISEIEQYDRVVLNVQPGIQVGGQAVNDIVHLVAEVVENATTFSPEETQVYVTGQPLSSGGVLLDITDNGVGISEQEMAHANWRLDNPPVVDVAVSRRMGLFVVGRLAARHGVRVRLRHAQSGGLTALVWLPESVAAPEAVGPLGRLRKFGAEDYGPAPSLSAPPSSPGGFGGQQPFSLPGGVPGADGLGVGPGVSSPGAGPGVSSPGVGRGAGSGRGGNADPGFGGDGPGGGPLPVRQPGSSQQGPMRWGFQQGGPGGGSFPSSVPGPASTPPGNSSGSADFGSAALPAFGDSASSGSGPLPGPGNGVGPGNGTGPGNGVGLGTGAGVGNSAGGGPGSGRSPAVSGSDGSSVTVPPAGGTGQDQRLPIFDSLESDWFRRSGKPISSGAEAAAAESPSWSSAADEGWRAARAAASPNASETTTAGLPKRVPRANLVPGSVGGGEQVEAAPPARSADNVRNRMASFQRGVREARAAAAQIEEP